VTHFAGTATPQSLSSSVTAIGPGRPTRGRRLPSGGEEQTERSEQDEGGNRPAKDLETHRATSFSGLTVSWSVLCSWRQRSRRRTTRSSTRATGSLRATVALNVVGDEPELTSSTTLSARLTPRSDRVCARMHEG
jgi:hypothetical protein